VKPFEMLKIPMILVGLGAALVLSPACKAQEVSPDHFTDTGVQDVYEGTPGKVAAPKQKPSTSQAGARQTNLAATLQPASKRAPLSAAQPGAQAVADKRKPAPTTLPKQ
jgi:hypothetical protein